MAIEVAGRLERLSRNQGNSLRPGAAETALNKSNHMYQKWSRPGAIAFSRVTPGDGRYPLRGTGAGRTCTW